jgi:hypothetical protein
MVGMAVVGGAGGAAGVGSRGVGGLVWPSVRSSGRLGGMAGAGGAGCLAGDRFCCRAEMTGLRLCARVARVVWARVVSLAQSDACKTADLLIIL